MIKDIYIFFLNKVLRIAILYSKKANKYENAYHREKEKKTRIMISKYENKEKHFKVHIIRIRINKSNLPKFNKYQLQIA